MYIHTVRGSFVVSIILLLHRSYGFISIVWMCVWLWTEQCIVYFHMVRCWPTVHYMNDTEMKWLNMGIWLWLYTAGTQLWINIIPYTKNCSHKSHETHRHTHNYTYTLYEYVCICVSACGTSVHVMVAQSTVADRFCHSASKCIRMMIEMSRSSSIQLPVFAFFHQTNGLVCVCLNEV